MAFYQVICVATLLTLLTTESESQLSDCGQAPLNTRIVGGQTAPAGNWPWQVSLQKPTHFCGGSLINNLWVMTAAHCVPTGNPSGLTVQLGLQSLQGSNLNQVSRTVAQIIVHPSYSSQTNDNDIALLRLSSSVTFTPYIRPVCLAASGSTFYSGVNSWVTGWGTIGSGVSLPAPQNLMEVEVPVVGNRQCNCNYGVGRITNNMICAGLAQGGKDSCQGDSGGPMVSKQGSVWIQEGIVSFGDGCALPNFPGVYTRVSQYQSWINSQITTNQPGFITFTSSGTDSDLSVSCPGLPPITTTTTTTTTPTTTTTTTTFMTKPTTTTTTTTPTTTSTTTALTQSTTPGPVVCGQAPLNFGPLGGSLASAGEWPWIVSLQKNGQHVCGGTLVSENSVLSSANCFSSSPNASEWTVVLGRLKQNGTNPFEVSLNVANITLSNLTGSNIALLQLSSRPPLSNYIQPICLENGRTFPEGSTCWASGWSAGRGGEEQVLQEYQTSVVNCGNVSASNSICTSLFTLEQGDSGGPLMCKQDGSWFQVVVLSFVSSPTRKKRQTPVRIFDTLTRFQAFLVKSLGTLLSPPSKNNITTNNTATNNSLNVTNTTTTMTSGGTYNHLSFFLFCLHLFVLTLCLQLFS